ncbi:MAG TPA: hypothetical protein VGE46_02365 [Bdellovibrio sp.]
MTTLLDEYQKNESPSAEVQVFLKSLETQIAEDLWKSAGGFWSEASIQKFRETAMLKFAAKMHNPPGRPVQELWIEVVRDFHGDYWGEVRLEKKEKNPQTEDQKIFWELFSYIWVLIQAALIMKTVVFYFGIKSAQEEGVAEGKWYVFLAIAFSFLSLSFFAFRKYRKK